MDRLSREQVKHRDRRDGTQRQHDIATLGIAWAARRGQQRGQVQPIAGHAAPQPGFRFQRQRQEAGTDLAGPTGAHQPLLPFHA
jgi:hypothetical protein